MRVPLSVNPRPAPPNRRYKDVSVCVILFPLQRTTSPAPLPSPPSLDHLLVGESQPAGVRAAASELLYLVTKQRQLCLLSVRAEMGFALAGDSAFVCVRVSA